MNPIILGAWLVIILVLLCLAVWVVFGPKDV